MYSFTERMDENNYCTLARTPDFIENCISIVFPVFAIVAVLDTSLVAK